MLWQGGRGEGAASSAHVEKVVRDLAAKPFTLRLVEISRWDELSVYTNDIPSRFGSSRHAH